MSYVIFVVSLAKAPNTENLTSRLSLNVKRLNTGYTSIRTRIFPMRSKGRC